jgi:alpha-glucosidase
VFYQVYPRSFADGDGDGSGDLRGVVQRIPYLADLGVDALWLCPFYRSPDVDGGYDISDHCDVAADLGTLADVDDVLTAAHRHGLRVLVDLVPNHCSDQHPWFQAAVSAGRGSPERARFHFLEGRGPDGGEPPNNWISVFGGPSWTRVVEPDGSPGQWYYHLFAPEQPDFNWGHPDVADEFGRILRFWLDRGVDGFRIDVSDALIKDTTWPDTPRGEPVIPKDEASGVHDVYRQFRRILDAYPGDRAAVIETGAPDDVVALFIRPDEMHLAFNFRFLHATWSAADLRDAIDHSLAANALVGAPTTWVTDNHDTPRSVTRYGAETRLAGSYVPDVAGSSAPSAAASLAVGTRRARAVALLLLALPGAAFLYGGQELGLPNVDDLPDTVLRDPIFRRSGGAARGRDGCRIPLPWSGTVPPFGFSPAGVATWLPQPPAWESLTVEHQLADPASMLTLHRRMLALRRSEVSLRRGVVEWLDRGEMRPVLSLERSAPGGRRIGVIVNLSGSVVALPPGEVLLSSVELEPDGRLPAEASALVALV